MALARVKVINPGDVILSADWNSEFNNILNNPITLVSPTTGAINFQTSVAHTNLAPSAIAATSGGGLPAIPSKVTGVFGSASSQSITFNALNYFLRTTAGFPTTFPLYSTDSFTVNVGATSSPAANGRDVAAAFSSTFVHFYAISTGAGSTAPAGIASSTPPPTGPVLPSGYNAWAYLGTLQYSSATTTLLTGQVQSGNRTINTLTPTILSCGRATTETAVSLSTAVPAIASRITLDINAAISAGGAGNRPTFRVISGSNYSQYRSTGEPASAVPSWFPLDIPNISQQVFYLHSSVGGGAGIDPTAGFGVNIALQGYTVPNGDD